MILYDGGGSRCTRVDNHDGHLPGGYDYALLYEEGVGITQVFLDGEGQYVAPPVEGDTWDTVQLCFEVNYLTHPETGRPPEAPTELPYTGPGDWLAGVAVALVTVGVVLVRWARRLAG